MPRAPPNDPPRARPPSVRAPPRLVPPRPLQTHGALNGFVKRHPEAFTVVRNKFVVCAGEEVDMGAILGSATAGMSST